MKASRQREWRLPVYLGLLLTLTSVLTFLIVGGVFLLTRIPQMEEEIRARGESEARELAFRIEMQMLAQQEQMALVATALRNNQSPSMLIADAIGEGKVFRALYLISSQGDVLAAGLTPEYRHLESEVIGSDLSGTPLFQEVRQRREIVWSDKYLSALSGVITVGLAIPIAGDQVLLAEIPINYLLSILDRNPANKQRSIWVVDQRGELLADTQAFMRPGELNIYNSPVLNAVLKDEPLPSRFSFNGHDYYVGGARSEALGWSFISRLPAGFDHPEIRMTTLIVCGGFLASLIIGALLAMYGASRLLRPLARVVKQAHEVASGRPVRLWPQGRIKEFNDLSTDIGQMASAILEREHELRELNSKLEARVVKRTEELSRAKEVAEEANRAKSTFLANMSHEIRTPLNAIAGMAALMRRAGLEQEQETRLDKLEAAGGHLLEIINMVLDLSKIEAGKLTLQEDVFPLGSLFENVISMLHERALEKHLSLSFELPDLPPLLCGDRIRLQQSLLNYATNAVKFTEQGSVFMTAVLLEETEEDVLIRFEVRDTGIGIAPEVQKRLFKPFEQADGSTTRQYGGTGLGLAITAKIAAAMGGETGLESEIGNGSTFWFTARLRKAILGSQEAHEEPTCGAEQGLLKDFAGIRVLLVDDEPINREITQILLEDLHFRIDSAENGEEALALACIYPYDLILMDMQMPVMDGLEATRRIRALPDGHRFLIIAMTANAFSEDRERCLAAGMDDFTTKPIDPEAFFSLIHRHLSVRNDPGRRPTEPGRENA
ncbi:MAG: Response regulator [Proteobacteria bacterium]|nr:Response regulator [Pseudomonadota bacterium]